jgi:hypothetical protein
MEKDLAAFYPTSLREMANYSDLKDSSVWSLEVLIFHFQVSQRSKANENEDLSSIPYTPLSEISMFQSSSRRQLPECRLVEDCWLPNSMIPDTLIAD